VQPDMFLDAIDPSGRDLGEIGTQVVYDNWGIDIHREERRCCGNKRDYYCQEKQHRFAHAKSSLLSDRASVALQGENSISENQLMRNLLLECRIAESLGRRWEVRGIGH
jgi:hypothetical protein